MESSKRMADDESFIPGPLDTLLPGLRQKATRFAALPVHPRVVHARSPAGARSVVLSSFAAAANVRALHAALKPVVEAALLSELSRPAGELVEAEAGAALSALELYEFVGHPFDAQPALQPFGLQPAPLDDASAHRAMALLRREAQQVDGEVPDEPRARYRASITGSSHPLASQLAAALREHAPRAPWGSSPGALARACADQLTQLGYPGVEPTRAGIERLEQVAVPRAHGVIRWVDPLVFQAMCDLLAVAAAASYGREVEWAVCEPDEETQLAPPPLIRVAGKRDSFHVPLGEHVLRWCVMPSTAGEEIPSLGAWAEHEFNEES